MDNLPLLKIYQNSFRTNYALPALSDYVTGETISYGDFAKKIARIHLLFRACNIKKGDKVALLGKNSPEWVSIFMATITYGAVIVPILNDFNPIDAQHIVNHSDSRLLFVSESIFEHMGFDDMPKVEAAVSLERPEVLAQNNKCNFRTALKNFKRLWDAKYPDGFSAQNIVYPEMTPYPTAFSAVS